MIFSYLFPGKQIKLCVKPKHIVIIPDGNRRYAKKNLLPYQFSYRKAKDTLKQIISVCNKEGIPYITFWGFSTENWKRSDNEKNILFELLDKTLTEYLEKLPQFRIIHIGRKDRLPEQIITKLNKLEKLTSKTLGLTLVLALDYGGQDELLRAMSKLKTKKNITAKDIEEQLDTKDLPNPDLIIRTSGEKRLSGIYPWQSAYSELYFCNCYFPEFNKQELYKALFNYQNRKRNFGK